MIDPLRVLVLGGTGQTGPDLVGTLLARGHAVTLANRGQHGETPDGAEHLVIDRDPEKTRGLDAIREACAAGHSWDVVVDVWPKVPKIVERSAELLKDHAERYTYVSSISVYADHNTPVDDESAATLSLPDVDEHEFSMKLYGHFKAECEARVRAHFPGDRHTVWRPGLIVGRRDATFRGGYWPTRVRAGGTVLAPGDGEDRVQFIDVRDLVEFQVRCLEAKTPGTFNVTGPDAPITMRAYLDVCRDASGSDATLEWVDWPTIQKHDVGYWKDLPCWIPRGQEHDGFGQRSVRKATDAGLTFRPLSDTINDTLAWYDGLDPEARAELHTKAGIDRETETCVLKSWTEQSA